MITVTSKEFDHAKDGRLVTAYEMRNDNGMFVRILDFGGIIQTLIVPDRNGTPTDVVLGYDDIASYENGTDFFGAIVGRCANRIKDAHFFMEGKEYQLEINREHNHLHGVFIERTFAVTVEGDTLVLRYLSPDGEEGFPGNLTVEIRYRLTEDNALELSYKATTDATTVVNLTNHSYFNLNGQDCSTIMDHELWLNCSHFTEYDEGFGQTGVITPVEGTPFDFSKAHKIGEHFNDDYYQLRLCTGYDHNMVLIGALGEMKPICRVKSEKSGITMEAFTTEPGIQFYSGNYMGYHPELREKNGVHYPQHGGFCMEAQHFPDSVNHANFPTTILYPDEVYRQKTVYRFGTTQ